MFSLCQTLQAKLSIDNYNLHLHNLLLWLRKSSLLLGKMWIRSCFHVIQRRIRITEYLLKKEEGHWKSQWRNRITKQKEVSSQGSICITPQEQEENQKDKMAECGGKKISNPNRTSHHSCKPKCSSGIGEIVTYLEWWTHLFILHVSKSKCHLIGKPVIKNLVNFGYLRIRNSD